MLLDEVLENEITARGLRTLPKIKVISEVEMKIEDQLYMAAEAATAKMVADKRAAEITRTRTLAKVRLQKKTFDEERYVMQNTANVANAERKEREKNIAS